MKLFQNEIINISKIHTVNRYKDEQEFEKCPSKHYNSNLATYELIFCCSGERIVHFGKNIMNDSPGFIRYLPKGIDADDYLVTTTSYGECVDVYFDTSDPMPDFAFVLKNMNDLNPLFFKIHTVWNSKKSGFYYESMSLFYEIIRKIRKNQDKYITNDKSKKIEASYDYLLKHFSEHDFDFKHMCRQSNLSYDYFKELFILHYGMSPVKYLTMLRMEKAKELLITGRYSVTEIAGLCGFDNVYYFSSVFKKQIGISPKHYCIQKSD